MVLFNYSTKEITAKVVYYGPGLCGKTTNLQHIYDNLPASIQRGRMLSLATKTDRTLFFDFLPIDLGTIRGMRTRVQLYTVPGQVFYNSTRKLVLKGADGMVFVADSQEKMRDANLESFHNLEENCIENGIDVSQTPLVLQFNKRDLPGVSSLEDLNSLLNKYNAPFYESVATTGIGVHETLKAITKLVLHSLREKYAGAEKGVRRPAAVPGVRPTPSAPPPLPPHALPVEPVVLAEEPPAAVSPVGVFPAAVEEPAAEVAAAGGDLEALFSETDVEEGMEELSLEQHAAVPAPAPLVVEKPTPEGAGEPLIEGLLTRADAAEPAAPREDSFADLAIDLESELEVETPEPAGVVPMGLPVEQEEPPGPGPSPVEVPFSPPVEVASAPTISLQAGEGTNEVEVPLEIRVGGELQRFRLRVSLTRED